MALVLLAEFSTMTDLHRGREGQALQLVQHGTAWGVSKGGAAGQSLSPHFLLTHAPTPPDGCTHTSCQELEPGTGQSHPHTLGCQKPELRDGSKGI